MEVVKKTDTYTIFKKRSGRYGVKTTAGKWINGDEKVKVLIEAGLVKATLPKKDESASEETPSAEKSTSEEAPAEA